MIKQIVIGMLIILGLLISSCGPSPEAIATMTASACTPTPLPTPTPTPVPYGLTINVKDEEGNPVSIANVVLSEVDDDTHAVDEQGMATFQNLPGEVVTISIQAPGYLPYQSSETIERGENSFDLVLKVDPQGLLPVDACAAGETLIMVEDIQDQVMEGWSNLNARLESGAPGVEIIEDIEQPGNYVLKAYNTAESALTYEVGQYDEALGDAVVRFRVRNNSGQHLHVGWHSTVTGRYIAFIYAEQNGGRLEKFTDPTNFTAFQFKSRIGDGKWHTIEISTVENVYEIWIDGTKRGSWEDKQPLPDGVFMLAGDFWQPDTYIEYDNISICSLAAPFTSLYAE